MKEEVLRILRQHVYDAGNSMGQICPHPLEEAPDLLFL